MEWLDRMNQALEYIEAGLAADIDYDEVARLACCSSYHFARMFSFIAGATLSEYIRRRRLTLAAFELQKGGAKVIDTAFKYGYDSPEAFSRAFKALHGLSPSMVRKSGVVLKSYPKISFHISIKGDTEMNYRIEEKEGFTVFGVEMFSNMDDGKNFEEITAFWGHFYQSGMDRKLPSDPPGQHHAIMSYKEWVDGKMPYMICSVKKEGMDTTGFTEVSVPAARWAIFSTDVVPEGQITEPIQDIWKKIYAEWFPTSGYEHAALPDCEFYFLTEDGGEYAEIWIPLATRCGQGC